MKKQTANHPFVKGREGSELNWLVVNPNGALLAVLDSESEAYWFTRNRGHAQEAVFFKAPIDYASAPDLMRQRDKLREALKDLEAITSLANARQHAGCDVRPGDWSEIHHCCNQARAILAETEAKV